MENQIKKNKKKIEKVQEKNQDLEAEVEKQKNEIEDKN